MFKTTLFNSQGRLPGKEKREITQHFHTSQHNQWATSREH